MSYFCGKYASAALQASETINHHNSSNSSFLQYKKNRSITHNQNRKPIRRYSNALNLSSSQSPYGEKDKQWWPTSPMKSKEYVNSKKRQDDYIRIEQQSNKKPQQQWYFKSGKQRSHKPHRINTSFCVLQDRNEQLQRQRSQSKDASLSHSAKKYSRQCKEKSIELKRQLEKFRNQKAQHEINRSFCQKAEQHKENHLLAEGPERQVGLFRTYSKNKQKNFRSSNQKTMEKTGNNNDDGKSLLVHELFEENRLLKIQLLHLENKLLEVEVKLKDRENELLVSKQRWDHKESDLLKQLAQHSKLIESQSRRIQDLDSIVGQMQAVDKKFQPSIGSVIHEISLGGIQHVWETDNQSASHQSANFFHKVCEQFLLISKQLKDKQMTDKFLFRVSEMYSHLCQTEGLQLLRGDHQHRLQVLWEWIKKLGKQYERVQYLTKCYPLAL